MLNRCTTLKLYPGFESLPHRQFSRRRSLSGTSAAEPRAALNPLHPQNTVNPPDPAQFASYLLMVRRREHGYAMVALLVAMAVMAIMMTAAMPVWKTTTQREREAELIFRGQQYARAIGLYQRKMGPGTLPPSIDLLVEQRYLRKKYKDPITNDDFQLLSGAQAAAGQGGRQGGIGGAVGQAQQQLGQAAGALGQGRLGQAGPVIGGIMGVASKSTATSLRLYNNRDKYNEWTFVFVQAAQGPGARQPGEGGARRGQPGPFGGAADGRGGRGRGGNGGGLFPPGPGGSRGSGAGGQQLPIGGGRGRP